MSYRLGFVFGTLLVAYRASAQNPSITLTRNLSFGTNITGTATIAYNSANAAVFAVQFPNYTGAPTASFTFILPADLTDGYGDNLPISFAANSAAYHVNVNSTTGATTFNPNNGLDGNLGTAAHIDYFWLGGTITPGNNYTAASYMGTITVQVTVTVGTQQYTASQIINVTASLSGNVSLSASGTLNFSPIVAGTTPPSLGAQAVGAPTFTATGFRNRSTVSFPATATLNDGNGHTLTFTASLYGSSTNNQAGSHAITSGSTLGSTTGGTFYFWLGGSLGSVPIGQVAGTYSGTFAIRMTY
ncbi:MAG TPA: DUF4402 domain-containing protein [Candidatus Acidoferrales bacterium]|nr:DUF4402 domain-containing protein [Candidatus Acidoferrales bacterium]